jgi:hypothetical protein
MTTAMNTAKLARKTIEKRRRYIVKMAYRTVAYLGNASSPGFGGAVESVGPRDACWTWEDVAPSLIDGSNPISASSSLLMAGFAERVSALE